MIIEQKIDGIPRKTNERKAFFLDHFDEYRSKVDSFLRNRVPTGYDRDDVTQETLIKAYKQIENFRGESNFSTWIFKIAYNQAIDAIRKNKSKKRCTEILETEYDGWIKPRGDTRIRAPSEEIVSKEICESILYELENLKPHQKEVLHLRIDGMKYKDIAQQLGLNINTTLRRGQMGKIELEKRIHQYL